MGGLCFKQQVILEEISPVLISTPLEKPHQNVEIPVKTNSRKKLKKKECSQLAPVISNLSVQKVPQKITAAKRPFPNHTNAVSEYQDLKKRTLQLFSKSTSTKKAKFSQKKSRKNNFLKNVKKLMVTERENSPTITFDCSEKLESTHDIDMQREDNLRDGETEITEHSIISLDDKNEFLYEPITQNQKEILEQKDIRKDTKKRSFFPFMRKLHCEIAYTARTANSYCEALLPICNKIKEHIDLILQSIDKSKIKY